MNRVHLDSWHGWPVFCPFCGNKSSNDLDITPCKHLTFIVAEGDFQYISHRIIDAANIEESDLEGNFMGHRDAEKYGGYDRLVQLISESELFPNFVEFVINAVSGLQKVGFAANPVELNYWGQEGVEPRAD